MLAIFLPLSSCQNQSCGSTFRGRVMNAFVLRDGRFTYGVCPYLLNLAQTIFDGGIL